MITSIAYYLLILIALRVFFKPDSSILCCGIAGVSVVKGLTPEQEQKVTMNMKLLALANQSRGEDGCGVYMNGEIFKGYEDSTNKIHTKKMVDFLGQPEWILPKLDSTLGTAMFMHARKTTSGASVRANTHPFYIKSVHNEKDDMILCHNGTIKNIWDMCREYEMKNSDYNVDSFALGAMIDKVGAKKALTKYDGAAALLWVKPAEPDILYVFHGASRTVKDGVIYYERPLCFLKTKEGIYFSSMEESLYAIRDSVDQQVFDVDANEVIRVRNGKFVHPRIAIDRADSCLYKAPVRPAYNWNEKPTEIGFKPTNQTGSSIIATEVLSAPKVSLVWSETMPVKPTEGTRILFAKNRYWFNGSLLVHGEQYLNCKGIVDDKTHHDTKAYYFWAGILLKSEADYNILLNVSKDASSWIRSQSVNFAYTISKFAAHPVTNSETEFITVNNIGSEPYWRFAFYEDGHRCKKNFSAKFSSRTYVINKQAFLEKIVSSDKLDKEFFIENLKTDSTNNDVLSVFDCSYKEINELVRTITVVEKLVVKEFLAEQLKADSPVDPVPAEIEDAYMTLLRNVIKNETCIRVELNDLTTTLETYVEMIELEYKNRGNSYSKEEEEFDKFIDGNFIIDTVEPTLPSTSIEEEEAFTTYTEEQIELEMTKEKLEMVIDQLAMLDETAEELKTINNDLAQESASVLYKSLDSIKHNLSEILVKNDCTNLSNELNRKVKTII